MDMDNHRDNHAAPQLDLIDLDQELPGQRRFISCWLSRCDRGSFIVDPGPPATADHLIARLEELGVTRLDHILLTHIHLDHGGATAQVLRRWPEARVICHKVGRKHLIDPTRLWEGSLQVLGHKAEVYGQPLPVPQSALVDDIQDSAAGIFGVLTPGHAPHHVAFIQAGHLFVGEAAGTFSSLGQDPENQGYVGDDYYLRPATPPRFFLSVATESLDRLLALDPAPHRICFAHHGSFSGDVAALLQTARGQLEQWVTTIENHLNLNWNTVVPGAGPELDGLLKQLPDILRAADPRFARGEQLPADIRQREADFTRQTLKGMLGFIAARNNTARE